MITTGLQAALDKAGTQAKLAEVCGVSQPTVWGWINKGNGRIPAEYVLAVEEKLGLARHDLRPDIYPAPDQAAAA
jgi:DNA-binding transcriptional regulator YdaS (Cro superfamily)